VSPHGLWGSPGWEVLHGTQRRGSTLDDAVTSVLAPPMGEGEALVGHWALPATAPMKPVMAGSRVQSLRRLPLGGRAVLGFCLDVMGW
jgi:hypothetical protein